jgi:CheY-like chemotaxis protein
MTLSRILLVDETPAEWQLALSNLAKDALSDQTTVVNDRDEALDFLHARGAFRRRVSGLPAVVVLGPNIKQATALSLVKDIRADAALRRLPVVIIAVAPDAQMVRSAYEQGANSLIRSHDDVNVRVEWYAALALFWGWANEPPPGSLRQPKAQRRKP